MICLLFGKQKALPGNTKQAGCLSKLSWSTEKAADVVRLPSAKKREKERGRGVGRDCKMHNG